MQKPIDQVLTCKHKIINQIAVFKLKLQIVEKNHQIKDLNASRMIRGLQIMIADVMKSISVYFVSYNPQNLQPDGRGRSGNQFSS